MPGFVKIQCMTENNSDFKKKESNCVIITKIGAYLVVNFGKRTIFHWDLVQHALTLAAEVGTYFPQSFAELMTPLWKDAICSQCTFRSVIFLNLQFNCMEENIFECGLLHLKYKAFVLVGGNRLQSNLAQHLAEYLSIYFWVLMRDLNKNNTSSLPVTNFRKWNKEVISLKLRMQLSWQES